MDFDESFYAPGPESHDVCISTCGAALYLHSRVLTMFSPWFAASMSTLWWKDNDPLRNSKYRYTYLLDVDNDDISTLIPAGQEREGHSPKTQDPEAADTLANFYHLYTQLFSAFYRLPLAIPDHHSLSALIDLADQYQCLPVVADSIRSTLFERPTLDREIRDAPTRFLTIGHKLRSVRIFREAFIHCVGLRTIADAPTPLIAAMITAEMYRLEQLVAAAMRQFLGLSGFGEYTRHVRSLVRGELGRCFDQYPEAGKEGKLFRMIVENPFTAEERGEERDWGGLQYQARGLVAKVKALAGELVLNNLRLKQEMDYLTCAELREDLLPWL
ncbi:hypothetical protein DFP73DRAFT_555582 [Morchella snyderi]|nr:hypothetical protein DFP73DRAFT_555582 [Morchella snyderi]